MSCNGMCPKKKTRFTSTLGVIFGLLSGVLLGVALFSDYWLYCVEYLSGFSFDKKTTLSFKVGLWNLCPIIVQDDAVVKSKSCIPIKYNSWDDEDNFNDIPDWKELDYTPTFVQKLRISTPFGCAGLALTTVATLCAILGQWKYRKNLLIACALYALSGIFIGGGLFVFASILSEVYYDALGSGQGHPLFNYTYSWSFFSAIAAFTFSQFSAFCCLSSYLKEFDSVEDMVRTTVPGANRRLGQLGVCTGSQAPRAPDLCEPVPPSSAVPEPIPEELLPQNLPPPIKVEEELHMSTLPSSKTRLPGLRYAEPPRPPPQFCTLPRARLTTINEGGKCSKSAV